MGHKDVSLRIAQMIADRGEMQQSQDLYSIGVDPCDPRSIAGLKPDIDSPPFASIRVFSGQYTWSIPVRMIGAIARAAG